MDTRCGKQGKDKITGFVGIIIGKCEYLYGCSRLGLAPPVDKDGKIHEVEWFDEGRIEIMSEGINPTVVQVEEPGGEGGDVPKENAAPRM